jgi:hypothetical protein
LNDSVTLAVCDLGGGRLVRRLRYVVPEATGIDDIGWRLRPRLGGSLRSLFRFRLGLGLGFGRRHDLCVGRCQLNGRADRLCARRWNRIGGFGRRHAGRCGLLGLRGNAGALVILVVRLATPEKGREQARLLADGCGIVAIATAFDVGAGQLIALHRTAIGGQVDSTSIREHSGELIVGHARPVTDAAGIEMDEGRA